MAAGNSVPTTPITIGGLAKITVKTTSYKQSSTIDVWKQDVLGDGAYSDWTVAFQGKTTDIDWSISANDIAAKRLWIAVEPGGNTPTSIYDIRVDVIGTDHDGDVRTIAHWVVPKGTPAATTAVHAILQFAA